MADDDPVTADHGARRRPADGCARRRDLGYEADRRKPSFDVSAREGVGHRVADDAADGSAASPPSPAPAGPVELLKSRGYVALLVLGADRRSRGRHGGVLLSEGGRRGTAIPLHDAARRSRVRRGTDVVADSAARGERTAGRPDDPLPARNRRAQAGRGIQAIRRSSSDRASWHHHCGLCHPQLRGRAGTRSTAHRHRQRNGHPGRTSDQARRAADGKRCDRRSRKLRRDQHARRRLSARRSLPAHGGVRDRWSVARSRPRTRLACRGRGRPDLHRAERMDGFRDLHAGHPRHPGVRHTGRSRIPLGGRDWPRRRPARKRYPTVGVAAPAHRRAPDSVVDTRGRSSGRWLRDRLRRGVRPKFLGGPLLRAERAAHAHRTSGRLDRGRAHTARRLQEPCLQRLAERFPRRSDLSRHVHRRRGRHARCPIFPVCR